MPMPPRPLPSRRKTGRGKRPNTNRKEREKRSAFRKCPVLSDNGRETERNAMNRPFLKTTLRKKMTARSDDTRRRPFGPGGPKAVPSTKTATKNEKNRKSSRRTCRQQARKDPKTVLSDKPAMGKPAAAGRSGSATGDSPYENGHRTSRSCARISVELEGVEPSSKQGTRGLSTRLSFD